MMICAFLTHRRESGYLAYFNLTIIAALEPSKLQFRHSHGLGALGVTEMSLGTDACSYDDELKLDRLELDGRGNWLSILAQTRTINGIPFYADYILNQAID
jgi:hypothetical protein